MRGVRTDDAQKSSWRLLRVWPAGLRLYAEDVLERVNVKVGLGQQALELGVLGFKFPQLLGIRGLHATELGAPLVERCIAETALAAQFLDRHPRLCLLEEANDLLFGESALLHIHHSPG